MISSLKGERTPAEGDGTNDAPFPSLNNAELSYEIYGICFFDSSLYVSVMQGRSSWVEPVLS